jgi:hypothetical protein
MTEALSMAAVICLVACHSGPADHFATFAEGLTQDGYEVQVYASGPAVKKFQDRKINVTWEFSADNLWQEEERKLADQIAQRCSKASVVITDVGHAFGIALQKSLKEKAPTVLHAAYYDNPEPYVPGGYSSVAAEVMCLAKKVLFANANLAKEPIYREPSSEMQLDFNKRVGIGYYPISQTEKIKQRRKEEHIKMREKLFETSGLKDTGQKVLAYFGGNNTEYEKAFSRFLEILADPNTDFSKFIIVMQQHPSGNTKKNDDEKLAQWMQERGKKAHAPKFIPSIWSTEDVQVMADMFLYYQTSMGPQFVLEGAPTMQVGHKKYEDILVRSGLCPSVTTAPEFISALARVDQFVQTEEQRKTIIESLGIREDWLKILESAL